MGSACTSSNDKKYKKITKKEKNGRSEDDEEFGNADNKGVSIDYQVYQLIKKEDINGLISYINSVELGINEYIFNSELTILHRAIHLRTSPQFIELLIEKGAKLENVEITTMNTPLYIAVLDLNPEIVSTLLQYSPNIYHKNNENKNLLEIIDYSYKENLPPIQEEKLNSIIRMIASYKKKLIDTQSLD